MRYVCIVLILMGVLLVGCASTLPPLLREPLPDNPTLMQVNADISAYAGRKVRWGGSVYHLENRAQDTWLEIIERPLDDRARPSTSDRTGGRFIAVVAGFLDPAIYTQGREVTIMGIVDEERVAKIGEYEYRFPVIKANAVYLWAPLESLPPRMRDPFWYDPWFPYWPRWHRPYYY